MHFGHKKAFRILDPRYRFGNGVQDEHIFLQGPIVFYMPEHDGWGIARGPGEEDSDAGNTRNILRFDRTHELVNRDDPLATTLPNLNGSAVPNQHDPIDQCGQKQRNVTALSHLDEIRREETRVDAEEHTCDRGARQQAPAPYISHRDK